MESINVNGKKDDTREKILLFIVGLLVGALIATAAFLVCVKTLGVSAAPGGGQQIEQMQGGPGGQSDQNGQPPALPDGSNDSNSQSGTDQNSQDGQNGQPPALPDGSSDSNGQNGTDQNGQPPAPPSGGNGPGSNGNGNGGGNGPSQSGN